MNRFTVLESQSRLSTNLHRDAVLDEEADLDVHGVEVLLQLLVLADQLRYVA